LALVASAAVAFWKWTPSAPTPLPPPSAADESDESRITELHERAVSLQAKENWREAEEAWDKLLDELPAVDDDAVETLRAEAEYNRRITARHAHPNSAPVAELNFAEPAQRPPMIAERDVIKFYPVGRAIRSVAYLHANGKGSNTSWVFRSDASFLYEYRVVVETRVKENRGTAVVFQQHFKSVDELRAVSDRDLELQLPDSPILKLVWDEVDETLSLHPAYRIVKRLGQMAAALDPGGRRTLTRLNRFLTDNGLGLGDDHLELAVRIRELTGQALEIEYVAGLGVTYIKVLGGRPARPRPSRPGRTWRQPLHGLFHR
jgi:hypothetical protein